MCFSATASFVAGGGLALLGADAFRVAPKKRRVLALIPLMFAVQQALEGIQWLSLDTGTTCPAAGYGFLSFAYVIWPIAIPLFIYALDPRSRHIVRWLVLLGVTVAGLHLWEMWTRVLTISVLDRHIVYDLGMPWGQQSAALYVIAVCGACFASRIPAFRWYGALVLTAAVIAHTLAASAFPSVWCFLAALSSIPIWWYLRFRK